MTRRTMSSRSRFAGSAMLAITVSVAACGGGGGGDGGASAGPSVLGGVVSGLAQGQTVVLLNNGVDALTVSANGAFSFATRPVSGSTYDVTVDTRSSSANCAVANGSGTINADVPVVIVTCGVVPAPGGPGTDPNPAPDMSLLTGDWLQEFCAPFSGGTSVKNLVRVVALSAGSVDYRLGIQQFGNTGCTGSDGTLAPATSQGTVSFDAARATSTLTAQYGNWTTIIGSNRVVWATKGTRLCMLGDASPTLFPTAASVEAAVDLPGQAQSCYLKIAPGS